MTDIFEEASYEEEPVILESQANTDLKVLGKKKSPEVYAIPKELVQATETGSVKILIRICSQIWKTKQCLRDWK